MNWTIFSLDYRINRKRCHEYPIKPNPPFIWWKMEGTGEMVGSFFTKENYPHLAHLTSSVSQLLRKSFSAALSQHIFVVFHSSRKKGKQRDKWKKKKKRKTLKREGKKKLYCIKRNSPSTRSLHEFHAVAVERVRKSRPWQRRVWGWVARRWCPFFVMSGPFPWILHNV